MKKIFIYYSNSGNGEEVANYLKEIIKAGQFQIVAQKNGIKASNLSALINQLESSVNQKLIKKSSNKVVPTQAALDIYDDIKEINMILRRIINKFDKDIGVSGTVSLWSVGGLTGTNVLKMIADFYAKYPSIKLNISTNIEEDLTNIDLVLVYDRFAQIPSGKKILSITQHMHFYSTQEYLDKHGEPKDIYDLFENYDLCLMKNLLTWKELEPYMKKVKHLHTVSDIMIVILNIINAGGGISLLPDWCTKECNSNLVKLKHVRFSIPLNVHLICRDGYENQIRILELAKLLQEAYFSDKDNEWSKCNG